MVATKSKPAAIDKYELLTSKVLSLMEQGIKPWVKEWHGNPCQNAITGHVYRGVNPLLCTIDMIINDWEHPYFLTFKQAESMGWQVKKGSKSVWIHFGGKCSKEDKETGEKTWYTAAKWFNVFNINQLSDDNASVMIAAHIEKVRKAASLNTDKRIISAEEFIKLQGSKLTHMGDAAFYSPDSDQIVLPPFAAFTSANAYYGTAAHEHIHWTGSEKRLKREFGRMGTPKYAFEELVAELGAVFVCNELRMEYDLQNHANYLNNWIQVLRGDSKAFMQAAGLAQKACKLLLNNAGMIEQEEVQSE